MSRHCTTKPLAEFFPLSHFPIWPTTIQTQGFDVFTYSFLVADLEVESWIKVWVLNKTQIQFVENFTFFSFQNVDMDVLNVWLWVIDWWWVFWIKNLVSGRCWIKVDHGLFCWVTWLSVAEIKVASWRQKGGGCLQGRGFVWG